MNVSLNPHFNSFISDLIESGRYNSASEVVRDALRLLEQQRSFEIEKLSYLRSEIQKGIDSGKSSTWDKDKFLVEARHRAEVEKE